MRSDFYVYVLLDPRKPGNFVYGDKLKFDHEPFYVGKGKGRRDISHFRLGNLSKDSERIKNTKKVNKIRKILSLNLTPIVVRVKKNTTEDIAFKLEMKAITLIGRGKNGPLVNCTDGGEGTSGYVWSAADKKRYSQYWKDWHANLSDEERLNRSRMFTEMNYARWAKRTPEAKAKLASAVSKAAKRRTPEERAALKDKFRQIQKNLPEHVQRKKNAKVSKGLKRFYANMTDEQKKAASTKLSAIRKVQWAGMSKEDRERRSAAIAEGYAKKPKREIKAKNAKIADTIVRQHASASLYDKRIRSFMVMCGVMLRNAVNSGADIDLDALKAKLRTRAERFYSKASNLEHEPSVLREKVRALIA